MTLLAEIAGAPASRSRVRDAVVLELARLCAVRRGDLLLAPDYGVDDVTFLFYTHPGGTEEWCLRFEETLRTYEPRLRGVTVTPGPVDALDLTLRVDIQAFLVAGDRLVPARFSAEIDAQRGLTVR